MLVVGCIHGNEPAGIAVARALEHAALPPHLAVWIVPDMNPDGVAARTRGNAAGVDLNRNFPLRWRPLGAPGTTYYSGPASLSEPESRAVAGLIRRVRPTVGIWFHQHLAVVDDSEGPRALEHRFAALVGLPARPLTDYPGSAVGWENSVRHRSAFVVELPAGTLTAQAVTRYAHAVLSVAAAGSSR